MSEVRLVDVPQRLRALPEGATFEQLLHALHEQAAAYASIASSYTHNWPLLLQAVDEIRAEMRASRAERRDLENSVEGIRSKVVLVEIDVRDVTRRVALLEEQAARDAAVAALPPMRVESRSSHDLARHLSRDVVEQVLAYEANPSTPPGPPSADVLASIVEDRAEARLATLKAAWLQQMEADRRLAVLADADVSRQIRLRTWIAVLAVIAGIVGAFISRFAR